MASSHPPFADPVATEEGWLAEQLRVLKRHVRLVAVVFGSTVAAVMLWSVMTRPVYQGVAKLLIERENPKVLAFKEVTEVDSARDDYYQTQYKLLQSRALVRKVLDEIDLFSHADFGGPYPEAAVQAARAAGAGESTLMESMIDQVQGRLTVQPEKNTRLVNVRFESHDAGIAAAVANTLARLYIDQMLEFRYTTSADAGRWLTSQIQDQRRKVEELEAQLRRLKEQEGLQNIEERRSLLAQRLQELGSAATSAKRLRLEKEAVFQQMKGSSSPEDLPEVIKNPVIQALRIDLGVLGRKEAQLAQRYLDQHPEILQVRKQIEDTRARIAGEAQRIMQAADNEYRTAQAQEASVLTALEAVKTEAEDLARRSVQYDTQKRELDAAKTVLDSLLSRAKETDVAQELRSSNIRIVDQAIIPRRPIRPNRLQDLVLAILLGLALGCGVAFMLENLDSTIKNAEDVRQYLAAPILGVVPEAGKDSTKESLLLGGSAGQPGSAALFEEYRVLRTALQYCWSEPGPRVIVVTSTLPGEGKTLTSVNLARSVAAMGASTLLVDGDLRKSDIHSILGKARVPGLSDVLVGRNDLSEALQSVPGSSVAFLSAGTPVPSPADLITGAAIRRLVEQLRGRYEWVVFDTAPVGAVADPLILAPLADGVLVVVGAERVPRAAARETVRRLMGTGVRILGVLLNRVRRGHHSYHYYSSYYGRSYGQAEVEQEETVASK